MPYIKGASNLSGTPYTLSGPGTHQQANNWETQYDEATLSFEQDLLAPFVLSGCTSAKDGSIASQLNVAAGLAFVKQADNTLRRRAPAGTNFSTSGHPSTTMWLFLQNDGTYSWQTSSTPPTNAIAIAHATTDGSSNILVVTDDRVTAINLFAAAVGIPQFAGSTLLRIKSAGGGAAGTTVWVGTTDPGGAAAEGDVWIKG